MDDTRQTITWRAHEHQPLEHSVDWFWALGIIATASAATAVILGNPLFGLLILTGGVTIGILARQEPQEATFELSERDLAINDTKYRTEDLRAFWILEDKDEPLLLVDTPRFMTPDLVIPLGNTDHNAVRAWFTRHEIPETELRESVAIKVLEVLGF